MRLKQYKTRTRSLARVPLSLNDINTIKYYKNLRPKSLKFPKNPVLLYPQGNFIGTQIHYNKSRKKNLKDISASIKKPYHHRVTSTLNKNKPGIQYNKIIKRSSSLN